MITMRRMDNARPVDPSGCGFCAAPDLPTAIDYLRAVPAGYEHPIMLTDDYGRILAKRETCGTIYRWQAHAWQPLD